MHEWIAGGTTFLASLMECVEAATIVLAVGYTAGWRTALSAAVWAFGSLILIAGLLGPALVRFVPLNDLKIAIGIFLTLFGYTWLRKAIWRYSGRKAIRDEDAAFSAEVADLRKHEKRYAFAAAFNGVLLEGFEVAVIVITFSAANAGAFLGAAAGALAAVVLIAGAAVLLRHPFSRVPKNALGFIVGIMLLSFGTFWSGEGLGLQWWRGEVALLWIIAAYLGGAMLLVAALKRPALYETGV